MSFVVFGCKEKSKPVENNVTSNIVADSSAPIWGVFEATLPCADCPGILTRIFLRKDFTYIKEENYQGITDTMPHIFYDLGKWMLKDSTITLTGQTSDTTRYRVWKDLTIQMLAQDGTAMPDSVASKYHFTFKGKNFETKKTFLVSGVLDRTNDKNTLFVCIWNQTVDVSFTPTAQMQLDSLRKNLKNADATKVILQGEATLVPHLSNKFQLEKVQALIDGDNCN